MVLLQRYDSYSPNLDPLLPSPRRDLDPRRDLVRERDHIRDPPAERAAVGDIPERRDGIRLRRRHGTVLRLLEPVLRRQVRDGAPLRHEHHRDDRLCQHRRFVGDIGSGAVPLVSG